MDAQHHLSVSLSDKQSGAGPLRFEIRPMEKIPSRNRREKKDDPSRKAPPSKQPSLQKPEYE
jgi:hypothetical protein